MGSHQNHSCVNFEWW